MTIPQAAGITGMLTAAGLGEREVSYWFDRPRPELGGLTPSALAAAQPLCPSYGQVLLDLAKDDAAEIARGLEGSQ